MRLCKSFGFEVTPRLNSIDYSLIIDFRLKPSAEYETKKKLTQVQ